MVRISRNWVAGVAMVTGLLGTGRVAMADSPDMKISLQVIDDVGVPSKVLMRAEAEATRIYEGIGVKLTWTDGMDIGDGVRFTVKIAATPSDPKGVDAQAMGLAPGTTTIRGTLVYVFYRRILSFAIGYRVDPGAILGHVIAHEIGHQLLPYNCHSKTGLMTGMWDQQEVRRATKGALSFSAEESRVITTRLVAARGAIMDPRPVSEGAADQAAR
jgi:hypothetical protein